MKFEVGFATILTTGGVAAQLMAIRSSSTEVCMLRELGLFPDSATSSKIALTRATSVSTTPSGNIAAQNILPGAPVSSTVIVTGWAVAPVVSATYLAEATLIGTAGAGIIWTWPADRPLRVGLGSAIAEIVLINLAVTATPVYRGYAIFES